MVLRCRGRINNSSLQPESKNPILLPPNHPFIDLLIRRTLQKIKHSSVQTTLTMLREHVWILSGTQSVKHVLRCCVTCRRHKGLPYSSCNMFQIYQAWVSQKLHTLLVEVKTVINSRQLTYVEDDQDGMNYTLSPSNLVNG